MASSEDKKIDGGDCGKDCDDLITKLASLELNSREVTETSDTVTTVDSISAYDFYSCEEAIKRLNEYLDHELKPEEKSVVLKHLQICAPCLERFQFEKSLIVVMRERVRRSVAPLKLKERLAAMMKNDN